MEVRRSEGVCGGEGVYGGGGCMVVRVYMYVEVRMCGGVRGEGPG